MSLVKYLVEECKYRNYCCVEGNRGVMKAHYASLQGTSEGNPFTEISGDIDAVIEINDKIYVFVVSTCSSEVNLI